MPNHCQSPRRRTERRRGSLTVEAALTLPILFTFVFASIEFSRVNMLNDTVENAAFEGARRGITPGATAAECKQEAEAILDMVGTAQYTVAVDPLVINENTEQVTVSIDVPLNAENGYIAPYFFKNRQVSKSITLLREMQ